MNTWSFWRSLQAMGVLLWAVSACGLRDLTSPSLSHDAADVTALSPSLWPGGPVPHFPEPERMEICVTFRAPLYFQFDYTVDLNTDGTIDRTGTRWVSQFYYLPCEEVVIGGSRSREHKVVLTQVVPPGYGSTYVVNEYRNGVYTTHPEAPGPTVTLFVNAVRFATVTFDNGPMYGCHFEYWRRSDHVGSWPYGYTPAMLFSSVFENAFPGLTLRDVLFLKGRGLNALGREAVAALLNAGSGFYWYTRHDVGDRFNDVFPGTEDEYDTVRLLFASKRVLGCPLD